MVDIFEDSENRELNGSVVLEWLEFVEILRKALRLGRMIG